ncbi:transcriptional regulator [Gordonia sp. DT30]|uniref:transcriptional regulator n=1 Tax=unclassified Gordonia (in: high G+C Gram-positive bacteria) TaxID=2657482 RepID=UPI003CF1761F
MSVQSGRRRHRPALLVLVALAAIVCLGLAWWQWDTYESGGGTAQNLGYALQWPAFGFAFIWAYRRFVVLESNPEELQKEAAEKGIREIPQDLLPERPTTPSASSLHNHSSGDDDDTMREYNRYLAELSAADHAAVNGRLATAMPDSSVSEDRSK